MSNTIRLRTLLRFTIGLSYWLQARHLVHATNFTVLDTNSSIVYEPAAWWFSSTNLCSNCIDPRLSTSFHEGVHPFISQTDEPPITKTGTSTSTSTPVTVRVQSSPSPTSSEAEGPEETERSGREQGHGGSRRRSLSRNLAKRLDPDDVGSLAFAPVTMSFNFTGSAIFLFATQPPLNSLRNVNETSTNMNISVQIDNVTLPTSPLNPPSAQYQPGQLVFSTSALSEGPHQLVVQVGENSTFIFERLIYSSAAVQSTSSPQATPSPTDGDSKQKKHNIATFAGAVGGSAGVLALFSLGLALSIIRRRHQAAKRERRDHESLHTEASDDSPEMAGPAPFVPRYFPDTVIPTDPPTYMNALATNHNNSTLLASLPAAAFGLTSRSYADIPPSTPPPPLEDNFLVPPPPPFPVDPPPPALPVQTDDTEEEGALPPSIAGAEFHSHHTVSVGADLTNEAPAPELVPLLHAALPTVRPRSRASARSVLSIPVSISASGVASGAGSSETEPADEATPLREDSAP